MPSVPTYSTICVSPAANKAEVLPLLNGAISAPPTQDNMARACYLDVVGANPTIATHYIGSFTKEKAPRRDAIVGVFSDPANVATYGVDYWTDAFINGRDLWAVVLSEFNLKECVVPL